MFQIPCVDVLGPLCDKFKPWVSLTQAYFYLICFLHIQLSRFKTKSLFWHLSWHITLPPSKHIEHTDSLSILIYWTGTFSIYPPWAWHFSFSRCFPPVLFPRCGLPRLPHPHGPELPELVFRLHGLGPAFWIFLECVLDILLGRIYGQNFIFSANFGQKNIWFFFKFIRIPWKWSTECFKPGCGYNWWMEISYFQIFWQKHFEKKTFQYLENGPLSVLKPVVDIIYW